MYVSRMVDNPKSKSTQPSPSPDAPDCIRKFEEGRQGGPGARGVRSQARTNKEPLASREWHSEIEGRPLLKVVHLHGSSPCRRSKLLSLG